MKRLFLAAAAVFIILFSFGTANAQGVIRMIDIREGGVRFFVPESWEEAPVSGYEEAKAGFACGGGEFAVFDFAPASELLPGANKKSDEDAAALLFGCGSRDVVNASIGGRECLSALLFPADADTADYHVLIMENDMAYHFIYRSTSGNLHRDGFSAMLGSISFFEPEPPAPSLAPPGEEMSAKPAVVVFSSAAYEPPRSHAVTGVGAAMLLLFSGWIGLIGAALCLRMRRKGKRQGK